MISRNNALNLTLSVICFAIVWAVGQGFLSLLRVEGHPLLSGLVRFVAAMGLFAFIFQVVMGIAGTAARRWLSKESKLVGNWYQVFQILNYDKSDDPADAIRHGPISVREAAGRLEISATNERVNNGSAPSTWYSDKVSIQGGQVWLLFTSNGAGRGSSHGNMLLQHEGKERNGRPNVLTGLFSDSSPATHYGTIRLYRDEGEYERNLEELATKFGAKSE